MQNINIIVYKSPCFFIFIDNLSEKGIGLEWKYKTRGTYLENLVGLINIRKNIA